MIDDEAMGTQTQMNQQMKDAMKGKAPVEVRHFES